MPRRNRNETFLDLLINLPWWVSIVAAGVVYFGLRPVLPSISAPNPSQIGISAALSPLAGLFAFLLLLMAPLSLARSIHRRRLLDRQTGLDSIKAMSWREFEMLCGEAYRRQGFTVKETGLGGADGGIDLVLRKGGEKWLVQCKRWRNAKLGVKEVREMYGIITAERADRGVFITCGAYTPDARAFAKGKRLDLVDGPALLELVRGLQTVPEPIEPSSSILLQALSVPSCPECKASMILRTAKRGGNAGKKFWGCSNFPGCRGIRAAG